MKMPKAILRQEDLGDQQRRVCSKKSVQPGRSHFCARSVLPVIEENTETRAHEHKCGWLRHPGGWFPCKRIEVHLASRNPSWRSIVKHPTR